VTFQGRPVAEGTVQFNDAKTSRGLGRIDFGALSVDPTSYVSSDFRHVESDLVLTAPFRRAGGSRRRKPVTLYLLIEHQSQPDRLMILRILD